jgi:hypothetical protein
MDTLCCVDSEGHRLVMNEAIECEWIKAVDGRGQESWQMYASRWTYAWYLDMVNRRRVDWVAYAPDDGVLSALLAKVNEQEKPSVVKDYPLISAALATDRTVVSLDDRMQRILRALAQSVATIQDIAWLHPLRNSVPVWLKGGAIPQKEHMLGAVLLT